jgi:predicted membrane protein
MQRTYNTLVATAVVLLTLSVLWAHGVIALLGVGYLLQLVIWQPSVTCR